MDPHKNIFYFYRGQTSKEDNTTDKQLENNLTKALINILDLGNLDVVTKNDSNLAPELFSKIIGEPTGKLRQIRLQEAIGKRTLDAVLSFENAIVGVESKFGSPIIASQLNEELDGLKGRKNPKIVVIAPSSEIKKNTGLWKNPKFKTISWQEIYDFFETKDMANDAKQKFLLDQYLEYMGLMHMTERFIKEDFEAISSEDKINEAIKDKLYQFINEVQKRISDIKTFNLSKKPDKNLWITLSKTKKAKEANKEFHFTSHLRPDGIDLMFNAEGHECPKRIADTLIDDDGNTTPHFDYFWEKIQGLETDRQALRSIIFKKVRKLRQGGDEEPIFELEMILQNKNHKYSKYSKQHEDTTRWRKECLLDILKQMKHIKDYGSSQYVWFRISCFVPKKDIHDIKSLVEQADHFSQAVRPIISFYTFFAGV